ncbi:MAG: hypothetical protein WC824_02405 [Bacteroidota bacterium]|jgi:hypothetical protein
MNARQTGSVRKNILLKQERRGHFALVAVVLLLLMNGVNTAHAHAEGADSLCIPEIVWPADSAGCLDSLVQFRWTPCFGATTYRLQVFENPESKYHSMLIDTVVTGDSITLRVKERYEGMIYGMLGWRLAAIRDTMQGEWSGINTFHVKSWRLLTWLDHPARQDSGFVDSVSFSWFIQPCAERYHFQLSMIPTFSSVFSEDSTLLDSTIVVRGLPLNTRFYWRVRPIGEGYGNRTLWSQVNDFRTHRGVPPVPMPLTPLDTVETAASTDLRWQKMGNTFTYDIVVFSSGGRMIAADSGLVWTLYPIDGLEYDTLYHWQVRGRNDAFTGEWSQAQHFFVREHPLGVASDVLPGEVSLEHSSPHPLRGAGNVRYFLPHAQSVHLTVHDLLGRERKVLYSSAQDAAGWHSCALNAYDLPFGIYLLVLRTARGITLRGLLVAD